ncbi:hypothetical protein [Nitrosopumilus sp.]|nr:hypothetical protein [Nitrosopumilus sp.]
MSSENDDIDLELPKTRKVIKESYFSEPDDSDSSDDSDTDD